MLLSLKTVLKKALYGAALKTPARNILLRQQFMYTPMQLMRLCELAEEAVDVDGCFLEIGAAYAATTVFLNDYLKENNLQVDYTIIDTFSGFTKEDVDYEIHERKISPKIRESFQINDEKWVRARLDNNNLSHVRLIKADATQFDFEKAAPIAFCLLDIDLYLPTKDILPKVYEAMADGGILVIDDCDKNHNEWNGAYQAYSEFVQELGQELNIERKKLGIIRK